MTPNHGNELAMSDTFFFFWYPSHFFWYLEQETQQPASKSIQSSPHQQNANRVLTMAARKTRPRDGFSTTMAQVLGWLIVVCYQPSHGTGTAGGWEDTGWCKETWRLLSLALITNIHIIQPPFFLYRITTVILLLHRFQVWLLFHALLSSMFITTLFFCILPLMFCSLSFLYISLKSFASNIHLVLYGFQSVLSAVERPWIFKWRTC